jgi:hypothetical protein
LHFKKETFFKMSNPTIRADVEELTQIDVEIKRNLDALRKLREKKKTLEANIAAFLNQKDIPGVKCNGDIIMLQRKNKTVTKSKKTRDQALIDLLKTTGISNPEEIAKQIKTVGKESVTMETIKINKK